MHKSALYLLLLAVIGWVEVDAQARSEKRNRKSDEAANERGWRAFERYERRENRQRLAKEKRVERCRIFGNNKCGFKVLASVYSIGQSFGHRYVRVASGELLLKTN